VNFTDDQLNGNEIVTDVDEDPFLYIATHPILIYRLIRRFVVDLQPILARLKIRGLNPTTLKLIALCYVSI
jgi:hypothetical protein